MTEQTKLSLARFAEKIERLETMRTTFERLITDISGISNVNLESFDSTRDPVVRRLSKIGNPDLIFSYEAFRTRVIGLIERIEQRKLSEKEYLFLLRAPDQEIIIKCLEQVNNYDDPLFGDIKHAN